MDFSLILPTLGDKAKVKMFLDSVERTTRKKSRIEVLFAIDEGKTDIIDFVEKQGYTFPTIFFERPSTSNFSNDYYNWLANRSNGDNIWACNDDIRIRTGWWDDKIREKIDRHQWSIYLVDTKESTRGKINHGFCCFPIISRRAVNELGFFFYPQIRVYPADKIIYELFQNIDRVIDAQDVIINSKYVSEDKNPRMWKIFQEDLKAGLIEINITPEVIKLLMSGKDDAGPKKDSKLRRIINIIREK